MGKPNLEERVEQHSLKLDVSRHSREQQNKILYLLETNRIPYSYRKGEIRIRTTDEKRVKKIFKNNRTYPDRRMHNHQFITSNNSIYTRYSRPKAFY